AGAGTTVTMTAAAPPVRPTFPSTALAVKWPSRAGRYQPYSWQGTHGHDTSSRPMHALNEPTAEPRSPAQATDLSRLVELEARWENLCDLSISEPEGPVWRAALGRKQRAYNGFRAALTAYNGRWQPAYVPEFLLNTPPRLRGWCRQMHALYQQAEPGPYPVH